jgi:hypothetical protein
MSAQDFKHVAIMADEMGYRVGQFIENVRVRMSVYRGHNVDIYYVEDADLYKECKAYYQEYEEAKKFD